MNMRTKFFSQLFKKENTRESVFPRSGWVLERKHGYDVNKFFKILPSILPAGSTLCLEGGCSDEVHSFLKFNSIPESLKIPAGTIWPKEGIFHLPGSEKIIKSLENFSSKMSAVEICFHFHAYKDGKVLVSAYDFGGSSIELSNVIPDSEIKRLAVELECSYEPFERQKKAN